MSEIPTTDEITNIVKRAERKNAKPEDVQALRSLVRRTPALADEMISLTKQTYETIIASTTGNQASSTLLYEHCRNRRNDLGYANASPLERMLIDAVVLAWLRYQMVERGATAALSGSHGLVQGAYWDKRLSSAQRRYLRAIETLARVRRLALPMLQVNIAEKQQVNNQGR